MKTKLTIETIESCIETPWDFGNAVLSNLCKENFLHVETEKIIAKVWLIGRSYSAAIERRKRKILINDNFYEDTVAPAFLNSEIDSYLNKLRKQEKLTIENLPLILETHNYLTQLTASITELENVLFAQSAYTSIYLTCSSFMTVVL